MKQRFRSGGLAAWSIRHPVGISMLTLTAVVIGLFALQRLGIDLLPHIIYPEVRVRILDPGVPARIMEDQVTRQLEEQLAITEDAIQVQSNSKEGRSEVNLSFPYGTDIDIALRDASTRLDRAKRFLPDTIEPAIIYKLDPAQIPILELVASSDALNPIELRTWIDYTFSKWLLNLPGVAAVEVGGGLEREIEVIANQERLASIGISLVELSNIIRRENEDAPGGRVFTSNRELTARTLGRFTSIESLRLLPLWNSTNAQIDKSSHLNDVAQVIDSHEDERLRVRLNKVPGVKLSIQKQPKANTVAVVDIVKDRLQWLKDEKLMPNNISVAPVSDQSVFIRHSLRNAELAAFTGAILAMTVIYLFLGSLKRTLIIGSAIPIGILVTFVIMDISGLTLNIMTLGGLALGLGLLIDSTIVMLENITRHQHDTSSAEEYAVTAAQEVNSPIVASTATNLAAILPFLFIGGLTGLLFKELIITISSAMIAALIVALTLVPALGAKIKQQSSEGTALINNSFIKLKKYYTEHVHTFISNPVETIGLFIVVFIASISFIVFFSSQENIPNMDDGRVSINISGDPDIHLDTLDETTDRIEELLLDQPEVETLFTIAGGSIFGRTESIKSNKSTVVAQLVSVSKRDISSGDWVKRMEQKIKDLNLTGYQVKMNPPRVRGLKFSSGDDDISLRIRGDDLTVLKALGDEIVDRLQDTDGIRNVTHTYEEASEELKIQIDRQRAADLGISVDELGEVLRIALEGRIISEYIEGDRQFDIRLRLPRKDTATPEALENILVGFHQGSPVRLREIADIKYGPAPTKIMRDQQQRIVEISASLVDGIDLKQITAAIDEKLEGLELPDGYFLYDAGFSKNLKSGQEEVITLLALAIFLVFVVMAVQYESLLNPLVIISSVPFAAIGVALGLGLFNMALSMPVFLGMIMLAGIVVNNAIMLVEQIEIERENIADAQQAIAHAASLRLRPILMTTLTTVFGMLPLAIGLGEGSEMLQPLAFVIVWGLSFSMLVTLVLIPAMYKVFHFTEPGTANNN